MYTKLFSHITESTVWHEDDPTRIVWITLLAMCDRDGFVHSSMLGVASRARVDPKFAEIALNKFLGPDPYSMSKEYDGRRIEAVEGGWRLLNYIKYREMKTAEERRSYMREYMRKKRSVNNPLANVNSVSTSDTDTDTDTDKNLSSLRSAKKGSRIPEGFKVSEALRTWADQNNFPSPDLHIGEFIDYWSSIPGHRGVKLDWDGTFRNWIRRAAERTKFTHERKTASQLRNERSAANIERAFRKVEAAENLSIPFRKGT